MLDAELITLKKKTQKDINKFITKVNDLGGTLDWYRGDVSSEKILMLSVCIGDPKKDANCVATIDWMIDDRYHARTFNVETYNESFDWSKDKLKLKKKLQALTAKYGAKFFEDELGK